MGYVQPINELQYHRICGVQIKQDISKQLRNSYNLPGGGKKKKKGISNDTNYNFYSKYTCELQAAMFTSQKENGMGLSSYVSQQTLPSAYSYYY